MDLTPSDEQRLLRESADRFVSETYTADHRRRIANDPLGFSADVWRQFANTLYYVRGGYEDPAGFQHLKEFYPNGLFLR